MHKKTFTKAMLSIPDQIILVQMMQKFVSENRFYHFADLACKTDWSIVVNLMFTTFLEQRRYDVRILGKAGIAEW